MIQKITQKQLEFFAGCMLGDGNMKLPTKCKNAMFSCQHGPTQLEYNKWKFNLLESLGAKFYTYTRKTPNKKTGKLYKYSLTITNCNEEITDMYKMLYKNGKKEISKEILDNFTEFSLFVLYMDDGSLTIPKNKDNSINSSYTIASCGFNKESLILFQKFLFDKWNIETTITIDNRLYIRINSRNLFEYLINQYVKEIPCLLYKLRDTSRNSVNCLGTPEEDNQQPSLSSNTFEGSTTSSESLNKDNNSTTKAEQPNFNQELYIKWKNLRKFYGYKVEDIV
jgi:hypothetical protein